MLTNQIAVPLWSLLIFFLWKPLCAQQMRWSLDDEGGINWQVDSNETHVDHIEMSGFKISAIIHYGVIEGILDYRTELIFPMLRTIPNDTHASLSFKSQINKFTRIKLNGLEVVEKPSYFFMKGILTSVSELNDAVTLKRSWFPSVDKALFFEKINIINNSQEKVIIDLPTMNTSDTTAQNDGVYGAYVLQIKSSLDGKISLNPHQELEYAICYSGRKINEATFSINLVNEFQKRKEFIANTFDRLEFRSPDNKLNKAFDFAKLRASESIYETKGGLMHGPGGGRYYAAIWANDQAEYANPFFPFLGNDAGNASAINSFRHFARYMNDEFNPIPSSIIAEGIDYWNGAGDRGDMAMIAYGASRFALSYGDFETAKELWPLIEWCLEYCKRQINEEGVVKSDCDELEFRFPAGKANLNTSCLYYDALISSALLGEEIGMDHLQNLSYLNEAGILRKNIELYFGSTLEGFNTYKYFKGNDKLRAWICTPLTVGIYDRSEETIAALFSEKLWTKDGLASESGDKTFWDRATLYALRGVFAAGETEKALDYLKYYSARRLLGNHVPYPVEAYPEGNQRHLSAESALYCRIITEGLFGIRPSGLRSFFITPRLPQAWEQMSLNKIHAFQNNFNIFVERKNDSLTLRITSENGKEYNFNFQAGETINFKF